MSYIEKKRRGVKKKWPAFPQKCYGNSLIKLKFPPIQIFHYVIKMSFSILIIESIKSKKNNAQIRVSIYLAEEVSRNWIQRTYQSDYDDIRVYIKIL